LVLLYLLALSPFLAGIYLDWRSSVVGAFLVVSALAATWPGNVARAFHCEWQCVETACAVNQSLNTVTFAVADPVKRGE
jgi:hypothetical protein